MLLGLIRPDAGIAKLFGRDPLVEGARALDGVAGFVEAPRFYPYLSGRRNLELVAALDGGGAQGRIDDGARHRRAGRPRRATRSAATRTACASASASPERCCATPRLLLLDEPTTGLDPAGMRDMRVLVRRLADQGITVLLSSPPDGRGRGAVRPRRDRAQRPRGLRGRARRADRLHRPGATSCAPPTTSVRSRSPPTSPASATCAATATGSRSPPTRTRPPGCRSRSARRASASARWCRAPATLEELFFRMTEGDANGAAPAASR